MRRATANLTQAGFVLLCAVAAPLRAQGVAGPTSLLLPDQLDTLVAPITLYPDPLLAQVLAASTYPLELVEAQQWIERHRELRGPQLIEAVKQQNWDASVQAMVAFPDALAMLTHDVRWTTDLGNAFLAQQGDVMAAVQRLRARAQSNGTLQTTPQQAVITQGDYARSAVAIQPADPQIIYVPAYNPVDVWGPPARGSYSSPYYPDSGFGFGAATFLSTLFSGLVSFGGWGWGLNWLSHGLFLNNLFLNHFGFGGGGVGGGFGDSTIWAHNPGHRLGVAYPSQVAGRFNSGGGNWRSFNNRGPFNDSRTFSGQSAQGWRSFGGGFRGSTPAQRYPTPQGSRTLQRGYERMTPRQSDRGYSNPSSQDYRNFSSGSTRAFVNPAPQRFRNPGPSANFRAPSNFSAPRSSSQHFSSPRPSAPRQGRSSAPRSSSRSGGHSSHSRKRH